ncbi:MAG: efflux RND transporter periplasmic adaptor subunit [Candidatus Moranbacteria bacterium]|nr:efflux RND transporter periplasmic adaptor subunit [Candidatus Moranbacteria bacterium]
MKKILTVALLAAAFVFAALYSKSKPQADTELPKKPVEVTLQQAKDSKEINKSLEFASLVVGDQESKIIARTSGTATFSPYNVGSFVSAGALVAKIDDSGNNLQAGGNAFRSSQVQQSELSKDEARKAMDQAKKYYKNLKDAYDRQEDDSSLAKTVSKAQVDSAKKQMQIAEIQFDSANVSLQGTLDDHLATSPISGYVTSILVSVGDYVSAGQEIATISQTKNIKFQFFVSDDQLSSVSKGKEITVSNNSGDSETAVIRNISPSADAETKRFLVEAFPKDANKSSFASGTVASVSLGISESVSDAADFILPLSVITVGQNESYVFVADGNHAKKAVVQVIRVSGEFAEVKGNIPADSSIIMNGSKLVKDGEEVAVKQ